MFLYDCICEKECLRNPLNLELSEDELFCGERVLFTISAHIDRVVVNSCDACIVYVDENCSCVAVVHCPVYLKLLIIMHCICELLVGFNYLVLFTQCSITVFESKLRSDDLRVVCAAL